MKIEGEAAPVIALEKVTVNYQYHTALEDITLYVPRGQFLAIVGPNGSGKTTLLKALLGLIRPTSGVIQVFGRPPWELNEKRRRIGYVPQIATIDARFPISAREVVMMGRYGRMGIGRRSSEGDREAVERALEQVGMSELAEQSLARLSGGQRQRIFVARALANEPELLLLDEPTTGVDPATTESFYELLRRLHLEGMTILAVSHDIGVVAQYADSIACLSQRLAAHGRPEEVMTGSVLACMYGPQAALLGHGPVPHMVVGEHVDLADISQDEPARGTADE